MFTITSSGNYIILDSGSNQWSIKKSYLTVEESGNYVILRWHEIENGKTFSRRSIRILYIDVSSPSSVSASDLKSQIDSMILSSGSTTWGSITGVLSNQTDLQAALNAKQNISEKNQPSGYAGLDGSSKLNGAQQVYGTTANTACEGNDSRLSDARTPTAHAASHVNGTDDIQLANGSQKGLLSSTDWTTFNNKQNALGYTPLNPANNLSDVSNVSTSRTNLGATTVGANLFTLTNPSAVRWIRINADNTVTARTAAETLSDIGAQASGSYLQSANNLSDVSNAVTAKDNLNVIDKYSTADLVTASTSLSTITGLSVTLSANKTYVFEASGSVSNSAANGCRLGINFPSGTCTLELTAGGTSVTTVTSESADYTTTGGVEIVRTFASVASTRLWWRISGVIEVGSTGGTFAIMGKTANVANTVTFHQRSRLSVRIIN